jgi:CBS domain containing-hemolysin-like protein
MTSKIVLILIAVFTVVLAGLFAGAETGMYRLSRLRLRLGIEKKQLPFIILGKTMHDSGGLLFSMLIGNNLAHYFATSIVTIMLLAEVEVEHTAELFATLITAPTLFVFGELLPKNIFFYRADSLMPALAPVLFTFQKLFSWCGAVPLLKYISRIIARLTGTPTSSKTVISDAREHHIKSILHETREEGFLSPVQADIINRIVTIPSIRIRSVMTPISKVQAIAQDSAYSVLLGRLKKYPFTRMLVFDRWPADIIGFVNIYEVLSSQEQFTDLRNFVKPVRKLAAESTVIDAINVMQAEKEL